MSFATLFRTEWFRLTRRRMTLILALLLVGLCAFVYVALILAITGSDAAGSDAQTVDDLKGLVEVRSLPPFGDDVVWQLVSIMGIILISASIGSEFAWRTVVTNVAWTGDRTRFMLSKFAVVGLLSALGVMLGFATCFVSAW